MDHLVSLVEAYLQLNGYFTVTQCPTIETAPKYEYEDVTGLDILGFRLPGAGCLVPGSSDHLLFEADPVLGTLTAEADMLIGEVREGRVKPNNGIRSPNVLRTVLARFGCCPYEMSTSVVKQLLSKGCVVTHHGYRVRLMVFGSQSSNPHPSVCQIIPLGHMVIFIEAYLRQNLSMLRHGEFKHLAQGLFMVLTNARHKQEESEEAL